MLYQCRTFNLIPFEAQTKGFSVECEPSHEKIRFFAYAKIKAQISCTADPDQRLYFRYTDSTIPPLIFLRDRSYFVKKCGCTVDSSGY